MGPTKLMVNQADYDVIATKLIEPWEIEEVGESIFISERNGSIVEIKNNNITRLPVLLDKDLSSQPEAGLLGLAFPHNFSNLAYAYYSYVENNEFYQRVVEIMRTEERWEESGVLIDRIPGGQFHQGGRIEIGPDQKLYITTGDATIPELAQDPTSLAGKIIRMNLDATVPADNPFPNSYVYSLGHRNPQGLAWDDDGNLYATEHGPSAHDEINLIKVGKNYGWPIIIGDETKEGMETPVVHSQENTWAPSGMTYIDGGFYFASLRGEGIRLFNPNSKEVTLIFSDVGRIRDVLATEDGLYAITNNTDGRGNPSEGDDRLLFIPRAVLQELLSM
ncbi:PQQ-dependent sugar dehydrogenase [Ornithinibacillus californiensis]|uniref:PQQ-dependent sugar dehydrogenase n=1 Tax=Ornithinibacillus californiensis TaxID=161536 RepID=UPI000A02AC85|nr:PQQ-dependent sugar dehydrogenase [Ornithinibacillus californiensis]